LRLSERHSRGLEFVGSDTAGQHKNSDLAKEGWGRWWPGEIETLLPVGKSPLTLGGVKGGPVEELKGKQELLKNPKIKTSRAIRLNLRTRICSESEENGGHFMGCNWERNQGLEAD